MTSCGDWVTGEDDEDQDQAEEVPTDNTLYDTVH